MLKLAAFNPSRTCPNRGASHITWSIAVTDCKLNQ
jgi:hypothetical protein